MHLFPRFSKVGGGTRPAGPIGWLRAPMWREGWRRVVRRLKCCANGESAACQQLVKYSRPTSFIHSLTRWPLSLCLSVPLSLYPSVPLQSDGAHQIMAGWTCIYLRPARPSPAPTPPHITWHGQPRWRLWSPTTWLWWRHACAVRHRCTWPRFLRTGDRALERARFCD